MDKKIITKVEESDPVVEMLSLENEILGISEDNFERDKKTIISIYTHIYDTKKELPKYSEIETNVMEYNWDKCYKSSVIMFDLEYSNDLIKECFGNRSTFNDRSSYIISALSNNMMNDIGWTYAQSIRLCIKQSLSDEGVVYEDDDVDNPVIRNPYFDYYSFKIISNNAQIVMFPELHKEEYRYTDDDIQNEFLEMTNYITERKTNIVNKNLLARGKH